MCCIITCHVVYSDMPRSQGLLGGGVNTPLTMLRSWLVISTPYLYRHEWLSDISQTTDPLLFRSLENPRVDTYEIHMGRCCPTVTDCLCPTLYSTLLYYTTLYYTSLLRCPCWPSPSSCSSLSDTSLRTSTSRRARTMHICIYIYIYTHYIYIYIYRERERDIHIIYVCVYIYIYIYTHMCYDMLCCATLYSAVSVLLLWLWLTIVLVWY